MQASIVITTRNRKCELRRALRSCFIQEGSPEIIVLDDASEDGTAAMVESEFEGVRLIRLEISVGYIVLRNLGAREAKGDVVFSIDDDAEFSEPDVVSKTMRDFNEHECIGAVAIPYIEPHKQNLLLQMAPDNRSVWQVPTFIGTAHAVRRELFLRLGGYFEEFVHQGEESDFCMRMLDSGYIVKCGYSSHIVHHESPKRDLRRIDYFGARNSILFLWRNVPLPQLVPHILATTCRCLFWTFQPCRLENRLRALLDAYRTLPSIKRSPVKTATYQRFMSLRRSGPFRTNLGGL